MQTIYRIINIEQLYTGGKSRGSLTDKHRYELANMSDF